MQYNQNNNPQYQQYNQQFDPQGQAYGQQQQYQPANFYQGNQPAYQEQMQQPQYQQPQQQQYEQQQNLNNPQQQQHQQNYQQQDPQQQQVYQQNIPQQYQQQYPDALTQFQKEQENQNRQQQYNQNLGIYQKPPDHQNISEVDRQFQEQYGQYQQQGNMQQPEEIINNVKPRTRTEREAMRDKESIEKSRINQRVGYEARNLDMKTLLQNPDANSTLYIPENQRFDKDYAVFDKQKREDDLRKRELIQEKHRVQGLERESRRWESIENQIIQEQQKREYQSKVLLAGKRNCNGLPYNPITLQYDNSDQGRKLKARDDDAKVRAYVRSDNLDSRSNSGYNILTGERRQGVEQLVPDHMKNAFDHKMKLKEEYYSVKWKPEEQYQQIPNQSQQYQQQPQQY